MIHGREIWRTLRVPLREFARSFWQTTLKKITFHNFFYLFIFLYFYLHYFNPFIFFLLSLRICTTQHLLRFLFFCSFAFIFTMPPSPNIDKWKKPCFSFRNIIDEDSLLTQTSITPTKDVIGSTFPLHAMGCSRLLWYGVASSSLLEDFFSKWQRGLSGSLIVNLDGTQRSITIED